MNEQKGRRGWLPSRREALGLLSHVGCSKSVINHCKAVADLAVETAEDCRKKGVYVDVDLVEIGALLHDIGRSRTHTVHHALVGVEIAKSRNLSQSVVSIIEHHVGGGITVEEAERIGWKPKSYVPRTLEEKIVSYADLLIEGSRRVPVEKTIKRFSRELPHDSIQRMRNLHDEITALLKDCDATSHSA